MALQLLLSVAEALYHIFSVGVLRNDVKGNNIVLEDVQGVKRGVIIDFGKACFIENAKGVYGTVHDCLVVFCERVGHVALIIICGDQ